MDSDQLLIEKFITEHLSAALLTIEKLNDEELSAFIGIIPFELSVQIISGMQSYKAARCLELIDQKLAVKFLEKMDVRSGELLLRQCNQEFCSKMLNALPEKPSSILRQSLSYRIDSVGAFMKPMFLGLRKQNSIQETIDVLRQEKELLSSQIYVVDGQGKLEGVVKISDLLTEENSTKLFSIIIVNIPTFMAETEIASVENHPGWYEFQEIPVIDSSDRLIGSLNIKSLPKNNKEKGVEVTNELIETSNALGELYWIGLTGFLQSVSK